MSIYLYKTYQFTLASELELPELYPVSASIEPQVWVRWGEVPQALEDPERVGVLFQVKRNQYLLAIPNIASYLVRDGREILVQPAQGSVESEIVLFLTSNCFPALLYQRGIFSMHASAVETPRGALLFCGSSGSGKSTLLAAFVQRGYRMLADDVTGIHFEDGQQPRVIPAYPRLKLWPDMIKKLDIPQEKLQRLRVKTEKQGMLLPEEYASELLPLYAIYNLSTNNRSQVQLEPLADGDRVLNVISNSAWRMLAEGSGQTELLFQSALQIARTTHIARLKRPRSRYCLDELITCIEEDLNL